MKMCGQIVYYVITKLKRADGILTFGTLNVLKKQNQQTNKNHNNKQTN